MKRVVCGECARTVPADVTGKLVGVHKNWEGQWCTGAWQAPHQVLGPIAEGPAS